MLQNVIQNIEYIADAEYINPLLYLPENECLQW